MARPDRYIFLKPEVTKQAAERRGFALNYKPFPNWLTYSRLLELGSIVMTELQDLKPRDMIGVIVAMTTPAVLSVVSNGPSLYASEV